MIFVERGSAPRGWLDEAAEKLPLMQAFFSEPLIRRRRRSFDFDVLFSKELTEQLRTALLAMFRSKCAYCETPVSGANAHVDLFRPRSGVSEASGEFLQDHYWRQAFEWDNHYLSCGPCTRNKANRFPINGVRAAPDADRVTLVSETPLVLDPCFDAPDEHLLFGEDGKASGATERGRVTIEVLNLNRAQLVAERRREAKEFLTASDEASRSALLDPGAPFLALKRQLSARTDQIETVRRTAETAQQQFDAERETVATDARAGLENYRSRARYIERVQIENIGSISNLDLDLSAAESGRVPWFALLGVNGVGKTTVLRSVALALSGKQYARRLRMTSNRLLRHGASEGRVTAQVSGYSEPIVMIARKNRPLTFNTDDARALVLAYGSTRLLPKGRHKAPSGMVHAKVDNLFDPFRPLRDAEAWLKDLDEEFFDDAAMTLRSLLPDDDAASLIRLSPEAEDPQLAMRIASDVPMSLRQLSDGYQSVIGLAVDIMDVMHLQGFKSMKAAQGVVLVDELGNHFHPRWKMRIVGALRRAFPQIQFIFSTHDPLCLRGLSGGEMAVLRRGREREVYALEDLPSVEGLRVDQLLTSEHFGLDTTLDPQAEEEMKRYRKLSVLRERTAEEDAELQELVAKLSDARLVASSRRERLLLELIDRDEQEHPPVPGQSIKAEQASAETLERLRQLVQAVNGRGV